VCKLVYVLQIDMEDDMKSKIIKAKRTTKI
jgi:hypothetical protein